MANLQLEALKKAFREFPVTIGDLVKKNPKELACLGFNFSDLDVSFKKSFFQFSAYYKEVPYLEKKKCKAFLEELKNAPEKIKEAFEKAKSMQHGGGDVDKGSDKK